MLDKFKEKAKQAQDTIKSKVTEAAQAGTERVKGAVSDVTQAGSAKVKQALASITEAGTEKVKEMVGNLNVITPVLTKLGYEVRVIRIGMSIVPELIIEIHGMTHHLDEAEMARAMEEFKDRKVLLALLAALQKASHFQSKVTIAGMKNDIVEIKLGVPPMVTSVFVKE